MPQFQDLVVPADVELRYLGNLLLARGDPPVSRLMTWEVLTWGMLSYAERLRPGALYHEPARAVPAGAPSPSTRTRNSPAP
jgi:hypothetical protein